MDDSVNASSQSQTGWLRIASSAELSSDEPLGRRIHGQDVVLYRATDGRVRMLDAYCPHLGANLLYGGRVQGDHLVCPFHAWRLDGHSGSVIEVPYSRRKLPTVCVRTWPLRETGGAIWAWHGAEGEPPIGEPDDMHVSSGVLSPGVQAQTHVPSAEARGLPPLPIGWFALCFSHELHAQHPLTRTWWGRRLRLERDAAGKPVVTPLDGGEPCPLVEQQQTVLAWFGPQGQAPQWTLADPDPRGWSRYQGHCWSGLTTHPQETSENSVDTAHFSIVHGYDNVETITEAYTDGPMLRATYAFTRSVLPKRFERKPLQIQFDVEVAGLGYSFVQSHVPALGLRGRQLILATPTEPGKMDLRISASVTVTRLPKVASNAACWGFMQAFIREVAADLDIWQRKRFVERPRLVEGDGPIGRYRRWARQFYPTSLGAAAQPEATV